MRCSGPQEQELARGISQVFPGNDRGLEIPLYLLFFHHLPLPSSYSHSPNEMTKNRLSTIDLVVRNLSSFAPGSKRQTLAAKSAEDHTRYILQEVNLRVQPGQVCLIMGGSGSGKTTLLNAIAGRSQSSIVGEILFNGESPNKYRRASQLGYLRQEDHLLPFISVRETLGFTADLRLPSIMSRQAKNDLVQSLIMELGLTECAETRIGDPGGDEAGQGGVRGISGGERRRVSAAIQLLTNPSLLLCDEVTSGLDAFTAFELVKTLSTYAQAAQKTVLLSIHQPRSEIFNLLSATEGQLVLLSRGRVVYSGPLDRVLDWFESAGAAPCPIHMNPFDYIVDTCEGLTPLPQRYKETAAATESSVPCPTNTIFSKSEGQAESTLPGLCPQVLTLCQRSWLNTRRNPSYLWGSFLVTFLLSIAVGAVFLQLDETLNSIRARASVCYLLCAFQPFLGMVLAIYKGVEEIKVFERERGDGLYGPLAHILSSVICQLPWTILSPALNSLVVYYMVGLRANLCWFVLVSVLLQCTILTLSIFCSAVERNFDRASLIGSAFFLPFAMSAGFIVSTSQLPYLLQWIKFISVLRLTYQVLISLEFTDRVFACPYEDESSPIPFISTLASRCAPFDGNRFLQDQLEGHVGYFPVPIAYFCIHFTAFAVAAWLVLSVCSPDSEFGSSMSPLELVQETISNLTSGNGKTATASQDPTTQGKEKKPLQTVIDIRQSVDDGEDTPRQPVEIRIENLSLLSKVQTFFKVGRCREVFSGRVAQSEVLANTYLRSISFVIPPAQLTAILGASGSGKTSLLNALLGRTPSNIGVTGNVYFNGARNPLVYKINAMSGYVRQDDNCLLSHLTVRQTLRYAVQLYTKKTLSVREQETKVEEIIDLVDLWDCADVLIGDDETTGCSGGQRRRVSIGIQLVNRPTCLFLDEPTTGLDARTAFSVMQTLKKIASCGQTTVVCTLHQPRQEIWDTLDNVMLLMPGGRLVYAGKTCDSLEYFARAGYELPKHANPSDFVLDTISMNYRSMTSDTSSTVSPGKQISLALESIVSSPSMSSQQILSKLVDNSRMLDGLKMSGGLPAVTVLSRRSLKNGLCQRGRLLARFFLPLAIVFLTVMFFWRLDRSAAGMASRLGLFHQLMGTTLAGLIVHIALFPREREIAFREISDGVYGASSFLLSYMAIEVPLSFLSALASTGVVFAVVGLQTNSGDIMYDDGTIAPSAKSVLSMIFVLFAYITTGESLGIAYSAWLGDHGGLGVALMNSTVLWLSFMAGFLVSTLPRALNYLNYGSIFKYSAIVLSLNEFEALKPIEVASAEDAASLFRDGRSVLKFLNFEEQKLGRNLAMIMMLMVAYRLLAWLCLEARVRTMFSSKGGKNEKQ